MYYDSELLASVAGLGSLKTEKNGSEVYIKGPKCLDSLQEIQRMWRKQNPEIRDVFAALGTWNTVKKDLIPILLTYRNDQKTIFATCKLLVMITMPPTPGTSNLAQQWETLQSYKEAFMSKEVLPAIVSFLAEPLSQNAGSRTQEASQLIELVLTLFRNLLHIPDPITSRAVSDTRENMHDSLILAFQKDHILELLIILAGMLEEKNNKGWDVLLLEIFYLILRKETPEGLLDAYVQNQKTANGHSSHTNSQANKENSPANGQSQGSGKLAALLAKEKSAKARVTATTARHSKFSGVFVAAQITGGQKVINNPVELTTSQITGKSVKVRGATGGATMPLPSAHYVRSSNELKLTLKPFVDQVLDECYNILMQSLKNSFAHETDERLIETDISNYLWLVRFFTGYYYLQQKMQIDENKSADPEEPIDVSRVSSTMDLLSFKTLIQKCETAMELKKWCLLDLSVGAVTEMINMLHLMSERGGSKMRHVALTMQTNIFYDRALFLDKVVHFVRTFDAGKQPKSLLVKLVQLVHVTLEMLEGHNHIYVAKRVPKKPKEKKSDDASKESATNGEEDANNAEKSAEKPENPEKSTETNNGAEKTPENTYSTEGQEGAPTNAEKSTSAEKSDAEMSDEKGAEKENSEKPAEEKPDENSEKPAETGAETSEATKESAEKEAAENGEKGEADAETNEEPQGARETRLNFHSYLNSFAHNAIISNYTFLLKSFKDNRAVTNQQIISLFDNIATKCSFNFLPMFYQLSVFVVFDKILNDPAVADPQHKEIYTFVNMVVSSFFEAAESNKFLFAAVLFWKTKHDCVLMSSNGQDDDYDEDFGVEDSSNTTETPTTTKMAPWKEDEDERLKSYFNTYKDSSSAIDLVMASMGAQRTAAEVYKRLDQLGKLTAAHRKAFADIAIEASSLLDEGDPDLPTTQLKPKPGGGGAQKPYDKRGFCHQLATSRGRGPKALAWLQTKVEEAALLRDRYEMEGAENSNPMAPYDLVPVNEEEEKYIQTCAKLLALFGFAPPRKGHLAFWRIPPTKAFLSSNLRVRVVELISQSLKYAALVKSKAKKREKRSRHHDWSESESEGENRYETESGDEEGEEEGGHEEESKKKKKSKNSLKSAGSDEKKGEESEEEGKSSKKKKKSKSKKSAKSAKSDTEKGKEEEEGESTKKKKKSKSKSLKRAESEEEKEGEGGPAEAVEDASEVRESKKRKKTNSEDESKEKITKSTKKAKKMKMTEEGEPSKKKKKSRAQYGEEEASLERESESEDKQMNKKKKKVRIQERGSGLEKEDDKKKHEKKARTEEAGEEEGEEEEENRTEKEKSEKKNENGHKRKEVEEEEEPVSTTKKKRLRKNLSGAEESTDIAPELTLPEEATPAEEVSIDIAEPISVTPLSSLPPSSLDDIFKEPSVPSSVNGSEEVDEEESEEVVVRVAPKHKRIAHIDSDEDV
eukprot:Phypoly_transcript_00566.p1 GENE.Phypoly_transcript_00566~~Phypoly_transcript_00566.p1  ORF type:complete len:1445 (+),score=379.68 Phypoly_transcript_00566:78-4412(+)